MITKIHAPQAVGTEVNAYLQYTKVFFAVVHVPIVRLFSVRILAARTVCLLVRSERSLREIVGVVVSQNDVIYREQQFSQFGTTRTT
jgi:hypothetical protein